ncbi:MAG: hypothetical protein U0Q19_17055 [Kineosporiaceae bacterium]
MSGQLVTIAADTDASRLRVIVAEVLPGRDLQVCGGRLATLTLDADAARAVTTALGLRGIAWGWQ